MHASSKMLSQTLLQQLPHGRGAELWPSVPRPQVLSPCHLHTRPLCVSAWASAGSPQGCAMPVAHPGLHLNPEDLLTAWQAGAPHRRARRRAPSHLCCTQQAVQQQTDPDPGKQGSSPSPLVVPTTLYRTVPLNADDGAPAGSSRPAAVQQRYWRIRQYNEKGDFKALSQLQTESFFVPPAVGPLRNLAYVNFRAEVVDSLRQKQRTLSEEAFQIFVAEDVTAAVQDLAGVLSPSLWSDCGRVSLVGPLNTGADAGAAGATAGAGAQSGGGMLEYVPAPAELCGDGAALQGTLVGTVEVTLMDAQEVLRSLSRGTEQYAYISSMTVAHSTRRMGLAHALLHVAERQGKAWSQPDIALHVYDDNEQAVKLYEKCDFKVLDRDPGWKKLLGGRVRLLMHRTLPVALPPSA